MGILETEDRDREYFPRSNFTLEPHSRDTDHSKMATGVGINATPLVSPTTLYPPHSYSYPPATTSVPPPSHQSSPRRSMEIDRDHPQTQPARQSLPSIHEALGNDSPLPYPSPSSTSSVSQHPPYHPLQSNVMPRPATEGPTGPPNPFSNHQTSAPFLREPQYLTQPGETSRSSLASISTQDSRKHSAPSASSGKSPTQSANTVATSLSASQGPSYDHGTSPSSLPPSDSYAVSQSAPYVPQGPNHHPHPHPGASYDARGLPGQWSDGRIDDKGGFPGGRPGISSAPPQDTMKRHYDGYDLETSLNEIMHGATRTLEFARSYAARAHQTQRSGPSYGSFPSVYEVDTMIQVQQQTHEALLKLRTAVLSQEHALAEHRARGPQNGYDEQRGSMYQEELKNNVNPGATDTKKRRGKAAPPGRCHSCNRAETPEWRRGPDGARTLCNACGLHYAKLTRKMGANKAAALGSNLRPKGVDSSSSAQR
ncbi:hypothetical protein VTN31DRAFT_5715 [Thermomyces dupontii]|uniref:uncharacterized protein n=1 Tax=Talaromyces thermophilus TaxID=28565 RepID=UPI0037422288